MKTVRMILTLVRSLLAHDADRRRERIERKPVVEPLEPLALLSGMEPGGAAVVPPHHNGGQLVIPINERPSFHVLYQTTDEGIVRASAKAALVETAPAAPPGAPQTPGVTAADDTSDDSSDDTDDDDDDDDGGDDGGDDDGDDNNGDEIDDDNNP